MNLELIKAIVILPGTALVYIPGAMLWLVAESGAAISLAGLARPRFWFALVLGASGLALAVWTVRLFRTVGEGTPAPWAPPKRLVVRGPYRHVRNPMITSVLLMLGAESLFFGSWHLADSRHRAAQPGPGRLRRQQQVRHTLLRATKRTYFPRTRLPLGSFRPGTPESRPAP